MGQQQLALRTDYLKQWNLNLQGNTIALYSLGKSVTKSTFSNETGVYVY